MSKNNLLPGSSILLGDNTIPGVQLPKDLKAVLPRIFQECRDMGLDYYDTVVQMLTYDEISEIAAYGGFPVRYPHWKFGMEYEELQRGYIYGMHRIFEMVINTSPCYIYCLDSNTLVDNVTVVSHALGHNDFFKNNIFFEPTKTNMMNQFANHGTRIRRYMSRWGKEKVTEFIDHCLRIETLIDPANAWKQKKIKNIVFRDERKYHHPKRLDVGHEYMEDYINPTEWLDAQREKIVKKEAAESIDLFEDPTKDVMGFLKDNASLKPWQADILAMLYEESIYFSPQRATKMLNEGWASFVDYHLMSRCGLVSLGQKKEDMGIVEYSKHKMGVLGGKYSANPYKLGFCIFLEMEEMWNKGKFGEEYDDCENILQKEKWDKKLDCDENGNELPWMSRPGTKKIFDIRRNYNDLLALQEFFTADFCRKYEFFDWQRFPSGEYKIASRDHKSIKKKLIRKYINGGLPIIKLMDPNHRDKNFMLLQHEWDGRILHEPYIVPVMESLHFIWKRPVVLSTKDNDETEMVYICGINGDNQVTLLSREDYEKEY